MHSSSNEFKLFSKYLSNASCVLGIVLKHHKALLASEINSLINPFSKDLIIKWRVCPPIVGTSFVSPQGKVENCEGRMNHSW